MDPIAIGKKIKEAYPQYANVDEAILGQKYLQKYGGAVSGIQSGQIGIKDIPEAQRTGVSIGLQGVGYEAPEKSNTTKQSFDASTNFIDILEKRFMSAGGGEYAGTGARVSGTKKSLAGELGVNPSAKTYNDARKGFAATLKQLTGDTGVLTENDYSRLAGLLPSLGATPEEAQNKFSDLRTQIAAKFAGEPQPTGYQTPQSKGGLLASLLPGIAQLYQGKQQEVQEQGLGAIPKQSLETLIPGLNLAEPGGARGAGEILTLLGLTGLAKSGLSKVRGLTKGGALENRAKVALESTQKISGENVYKKAEEKILKSVSEIDKKQAVKFLKEAKKGLVGKEFDAQTALDKLAQYNKAYTTSGAAGKSAKAAVNDALSKAMRNELPKDVMVAQKQLAKALGLSKTARGVGRQALGTTIGVGTVGLLALLGMNRARK